MKHLIATLIVVLAGAASALTLDEALEAAPARPGAVTAELARLRAETDNVRTVSDPLALRIDILQAEQDLELAQVQAAQALLAARAEIAAAYTAVLDARTGSELAAEGVALAETGVTITEIRVANGSATSLELLQSNIALDDARASLQSAVSGLRLAAGNLSSLIGRDVEPAELEPVGDHWLVPVPDVSLVEARAGDLPDALQVRHGLALATAAVEMLDPSYAPQAMIDSAQTQLATATTMAAEATRGLTLQARNLHLQAVNAAERLAVQEDSMAAADRTLEVERERLAAGLIAEIAFRQAELVHAQEQFALQQARHEYLRALMALERDAFVPVWGDSAAR